MTNIPRPKTPSKGAFCSQGSFTFETTGMAMMSMKISAEMLNTPSTYSKFQYDQHCVETAGTDQYPLNGRQALKHVISVATQPHATFQYLAIEPGMYVRESSV
ncbi:hypothetical protein KC332_g64 [Hortaea werneckii]|nr:hypothetical protein KC332_g64 [Hortaea werneckii]KAI7456576.1 hypothetical protein KC368_g95 [Hortaea werneckii]